MKKELQPNRWRSTSSHKPERHGPCCPALSWIALGATFSLLVARLDGACLVNNVLGLFGRSEEGERGPDPGDGAVIHDSSGEADFDGLSGNVLPPIKDDPDREQIKPRKRSAD